MCRSFVPCRHVILHFRFCLFLFIVGMKDFAEIKNVKSRFEFVEFELILILRSMPSITAYKRSWDRVMFSQAFVLGVTMWTLPMLHWTSLSPTPTWDLGSYHSPRYHTWDMGPTPSPLHVQTCSLEDIIPAFHCYWHLVVTIETSTVEKRAVHFLLECFLVS